MTGWEVVALFPPLVRFFAGVLLVLVVVGGSALFSFWIYSMYGEDKYEEE
jgi:hypothetical protein